MPYSIPLLPDPALRGQAPEDFTQTMDTFLSSLPPMVVQINGALVYIDQQADQASLSALASDASAESAHTSAVASADSAMAAAISAESAQSFAELAAGGSELPSFATQQGKALTVALVNGTAGLNWEYLSPQLVAVPAGITDVVGESWRHYLITDPATAVCIHLPSHPEPNDTLVISPLNGRFDNSVDFGTSMLITPIAALTGLITLDLIKDFFTFRFINSAFGWVME